jgi:hypothetical protein
MGATTFTSTEKPNLIALDIIINYWDDLPITDEQRKPIKMNKTEYPLLPMLKKYRRAVQNGTVLTAYEYSKNHTITGRQFAKGAPSLQGMKRWIRHTLATGYHDYDMVNCHPTIFVQYCKKQGWDTEPFESYLSNRDELLQELCDKNEITRDDAKKVVLSILNGGAKEYKNLQTKPLWLTMYKLAVENIQNNMKSDPQNVDLVTSIKEYKTYNIGGSVMNHILCRIENDILMCAIEFSKVKEPVLCFDGFMCTESFDEEHMTKMADHILDKTGYRMKWIEKPMDQGIDLSGFDISVRINQDRIVIYKLEDEASDLFLGKIKDIIRFSTDNYYLKVDGVWITNLKIIQKYLTAMCLKADYYKFSGLPHSPHQYSSGLTDAKKIVEATLIKVPNSPSFQNELSQSSIGKLVWNDGVYDFNTKVFTKGFDGVESVIKISRNFPERIQTDIDELHRRFLDPVFGHLKTTYLHYLSKCMAGYADKMWGVMMGERDCGKSKQITLLETAFEAYCIIVGGDNFVYSRERGGDQAKKRSWMIAMEYARHTSTSEIKVDAAARQKIDGVEIKSITGQDKIQVRNNYTNERNIVIQSGLTICGNDIGAVTPTDTYETMIPFNLPNKFVNELNENFDFMKLKDDTIGDFVKCSKTGDALFWVLVDNFSRKPVVLTEQMKEFKNQFMEVDEFAIINEHFQITKNEKDFVSNEIIKRFLNASRVNLTSPKFKDYLTKRGAQDHREKGTRGLKYLVMIKEFKQEFDF